MMPLLGLLEILAISGGGLLAALFAYLKISRDSAVKKAEEAKAREDAITGRLARDEAVRTESEPIKLEDEKSRREHEAKQAHNDALIAATNARLAAERARTETAAAAGPEALTERSNQAIREGKLPRGRSQ